MGLVSAQAGNCLAGDALPHLGRLQRLQRPRRNAAPDSTCACHALHVSGVICVPFFVSTCCLLCVCVSVFVCFLCVCVCVCVFLFGLEFYFFLKRHIIGAFEVSLLGVSVSQQRRPRAMLRGRVVL